MEIINQIKERICPENSNIKAEFYKLNLYEKGRFLPNIKIRYVKKIILEHL